MEQIYTHPPLSDYVLGLLSVQEKQQVEQHIVQCDRCRVQLEQERKIGLAVRETVAAVAQPSALRLHQLMPSPPARRPRSFWWPAVNWQQFSAGVAVLKPVAALAVVMMLLFGSLSLGTTPYTAVAATMTATSTTLPTATLAEPVVDPALRPTVRPDDEYTPPPATPIAQLAPQPAERTQ